MKTTAIPFVAQIPVISTRHIPSTETLADLALELDTPIALYAEGGFVRMPPASACPEWLYPIAKWAKSNVFDWIHFNDEGDIVEGLPVFDWDAPVIHPDDNPAQGVDSASTTLITTVMGLPVFATTDLTPPDIKGLRDALWPFNIPRLSPPTQAEIDAFDTSQTDKRIAELRAAIAAYSEKMDDWQANADNEEELLRLLEQKK